MWFSIVKLRSDITSAQVICLPWSLPVSAVSNITTASLVASVSPIAFNSDKSTSKVKLPAPVIGFVPVVSIK